DHVGKTIVVDVNLTLDTTAPVTTPSVPAGTYQAPFRVDLTVSEPATIFYTVDGSIPYEGGPQTLIAETLVQDLPVYHTMNLQFFAKDIAGNTEAVQSLVYDFNQSPDPVTGASLAYNAPSVDLSWDSMTGATKYWVYRALNPVDVDMLNQSIQGGCPPPQTLRYSEVDVPLGTPPFQDADLLPGRTYYYGVTQVNEKGLESAVGQLMSYTVALAGQTEDIEAAKARALGWLDSQQNRTGAWGNRADYRILATSQVLNAYARAGKNDYSTHKALFFLRGNAAQNNDFRARKLLALDAFGQDIEAFVSKHITLGVYNGTQLNGWGMNQYYSYDPVDTALGMKVLAKSSQTLSNDLKNRMKLNAMWSSVDNKFAWVDNGSPSIFVSSLVYGAEKELNTWIADYDPAWILNSQSTAQDDTKGSFGTGVADTAAVILWIDSLPEDAKTMAQTYLAKQQQPDGSWGDAFVTGLCLEALYK
ncbi:MAG: chitobiase/beta-hexosaminidase C-terminal domain-containing protein, partial [Desulfobacterales bacterium]|nr:chitobiase/beta-hexosaminidase C-terminal domain-containing protein [Desulfobacterales bacterium]